MKNLQCERMKQMFPAIVFLLAFHQILGLKPLFTDPVLDPVFELQEHVSLTTDIAPLDCMDPDGRDVIVSLVSVEPENSPCSNCFQAYPSCGSGGSVNSFCLRFLPVGTFQYSTTREYTLTFSCRDTAGEVADLPYRVHIRLLPNTPPFFASAGPATISGTKSIRAGTELHVANCFDPEGDTLQYTLTTEPETNNVFSIDASGVIKADSDLKSLCRGSIAFYVTCQDPYHAPVESIISATLEGANQMPIITGINFNKDVSEDTPVGTTLGTFRVTDDDTTLDCQTATNPPNSLEFYDLDSQKRSIVVKKELNYEQTSTRITNVTVTCSDGFCTSYPGYLYIRVTDVNEQIDINPKDFTLSTYEGRIELDPKWTPIDEDENDSATYTIISGNTNGRFAINPQTGKITSTLEYDVDGGAMPTTETIVVQAKDKGGLTSTTTVTVSILDRNDNRPTFENVLGQTFSVQECNGAGTSPGSLTATDADSDFQGNNRITYSGSNGPLTIGPNGAVLIGAGVTAGSTYTVQATAKDAGQFPGPLSSAEPALVTVTVTACPTPAPTTTTVAAPTTTAGSGSSSGSRSGSRSGSGSGGFVDTSEANSADSLDENLGWMIVAGLLGTVLLAALGYMLWRSCYPFCRGLCSRNLSRNLFRGWCARDWCVVRETRRTSPIMSVIPVNRGQPPGAGNRGFWQERYPDDDYKVKDPQRDRIPTPANYEAGNSTLADMYQQNYSWRNSYGYSWQTSGGALPQ